MNDFASIADLAVNLNVITKQEKKIISQRGTRKALYTERHLRNLKEIIIERLSRKEALTKMEQVLLAKCKKH